MKNALVGVALLAAVMPSDFTLAFKKDKREYYEITVYHFKTQEQKVQMDTYLESAYLPALHRMGVSTVGIFTPIANDTASDKRIFIIVPAKSLEAIAELPGKLSKDAVYETAAKGYLDAVYNNPPYARMEKIISHAFPDAPVLNTPKLNSPKAEHVYEYRSYESPTEKIFKNKVQMFNEGGEVKLFKRLNFNAVFYSAVVAGASMPNLIYMTSFENMADRDAHWKSFGSDPEWKKLSSDHIYQHNVSKIDVILMRAASYSDY